MESGSKVKEFKLGSGSFCLFGAAVFERPELSCGARVFVFMQQKKEEEFVFTVIYRQEYCL